MTKLVFVRWYTQQAVYEGGQLVFSGEADRSSWSLLRKLGYDCQDGGEVPTHDIPREFDRGERGWWKSPLALSDLQQQFTAYRDRLKKERISDLKEELKGLLDD